MIYFNKNNLRNNGTCSGCGSMFIGGKCIFVSLGNAATETYETYICESCLRLLELEASNALKLCKMADNAKI